jgi:hypothetical protein
VNLTATETEQLGRLDDAQPALADLLHDFKTMQFLLRHDDQTGHDDSERSATLHVVIFPISVDGDQRRLSHL